ncbi:MAG: hypothetical protein Q4C91_03920 [Eubacteriales bacterium]|nr:hypothetical protein [Eubacteriales bacterium]
MRRERKKIFCLLSITIGLLLYPIAANADTYAFNVTTPASEYSYSVKKTNSEQKFYVRGVSFSKSGKLYCRSESCANRNVYGQTAISAENPVSSGEYVNYAAPNGLYRLSFYSSVSGLQVVGYYTP